MRACLHTAVDALCRRHSDRRASKLMHTHAPAGYIDLSKRRVAVEDIPKAEEKYNKAKAVHSIIKHVSGKLRVRVNFARAPCA